MHTAAFMGLLVSGLLIRALAGFHRVGLLVFGNQQSYSEKSFHMKSSIKEASTYDLTELRSPCVSRFIPSF